MDACNFLRLKFLRRLFKENETGTEHLLLALLKDDNNIAAHILNEENIDYKVIYNTLINGTEMKSFDEEFEEFAHSVIPCL